MNINGYNPYKKGFDMLVADIQEHEARCVTPSRCEPFSTKPSAEDLIARLRYSMSDKDGGIGLEAADALEAQAKRLDRFTAHELRLVAHIQTIELELERLRKIEAAAVTCSEHPVWNDDQFYGLMTELQRALRGEVGADKTANALGNRRAAFGASVLTDGLDVSMAKR